MSERSFFMKLHKELKYGLLLVCLLSLGFIYIYTFFIPMRGKIAAMDQNILLLQTLESKTQSNKSEIDFGQTKVISQKQQYESLENEVTSVLSDADLVIAMKETIDPYATKTDVTFLDPVYEDLLDKIKITITFKTNYSGLKNIILHLEKLSLQNSITGLHVNSGYLYTGLDRPNQPQSSEVKPVNKTIEEASSLNGERPAYDLQVEIEIEFTALHISRKKTESDLKTKDGQVPKNNLFE